MQRVSTTTLISLAFLAACSGGSTTFDGTNTTPPPAASFDIDSGNAMVVAGAAYGAVVTSGDLAGLAANTGLTADAGGSFAKPASDTQLGSALDRFLQKVPLGPGKCKCFELMYR